MNSLREMMETTFAAAAFAERNLPQDASTLFPQTGQSKLSTAEAKAASQSKRPRASLKV